MGVTGMKLGDGENDRIEWVCTSRDDGLQGVDQLGTNDDRINRPVRLRRMAAPSFDNDGELVRCCHDRPFANGKLADGKSGNIVHAIDFRDGKALHQAVLDHFAATAAAFFRRLEDNRD